MIHDLTFGPYLIDVDGNHCTIRRSDNDKVEPTFYELQHIKGLAFGGCNTAIEVFPAMKDLVDGENQRHLWKIDSNIVPNLKTGSGILHDSDKNNEDNNMDELSQISPHSNIDEADINKFVNEARDNPYIKETKKRSSDDDELTTSKVEDMRIGS